MKILIIDDNASVRRLIASTSSRLPVTFVNAKTAPARLQGASDYMLKNNLPDLVGLLERLRDNRGLEQSTS